MPKLRDLCDLLAPPETVGLPAPVTRRLGLAAPFTDAEAFCAAADWIEARPARDLCQDPADEVVYEAFLGPFLGFTGRIGTLVSLTCFLPFLIDDLRVTTLILLPLLERGRTSRKGAQGSPFAVADHSRLQPGTSGIEGVPQEEVWEAVVHAARTAGVRMGMVVPLAIVAMDSAHIADDPAIVYWWRAPAGEILAGERLDGEWPPFVTKARPVSSARELFVPPPSPSDVFSVTLGPDRFWVAGAGDRRITVANAYPDPVVGEDSTYAWRDVAAVRFGSGLVPGRYADTGGPHAGETLENAEAFVVRALGFRRAAGESAVLADVSSSLPARVMKQAIAPYPATLLMAEQLWSFSDRKPFQFATGPLAPCVAAHWAEPQTLATSLLYHLELHASTEDRRWFMAAVSNHDTLPCPPEWSRPLMLLFALLPQSVPFVFSGTDFGCEAVTNLEFGTLPPGRRRPTESELLLFNPVPVEVDDGRLQDFGEFWRELLALRGALSAVRGEAGASDVEREGLVVSGRLGEIEFAMNCGAAGVEWVTPPEPCGRRVWFSTHPVECTSAGVALPGLALVLRTPAGEKLRQLAGTLRRIHVSI